MFCPGRFWFGFLASLEDHRDELNRGFTPEIHHVFNLWPPEITNCFGFENCKLHVYISILDVKIDKIARFDKSGWFDDFGDEDEVHHKMVSSEFRILKSIFGCDSISGLPHISKNGRCATELSPCFWKRWGSEHQQSVPHPHKPTRSLCFSNFWTFRAAFSGKLFGESRRWRKKKMPGAEENVRRGHLPWFNLRWAAPWWISHSALLTGKTMNTSSPFFPFFRPKISFPEIGHRSNTFFPWWKNPIASYQIPKKAPIFNHEITKKLLSRVRLSEPTTSQPYSPVCR